MMPARWAGAPGTWVAPVKDSISKTSAASSTYSERATWKST